MKKMINKFVVAAISLATLLITGSALAATPTAVWDGDFNTATKSGWTLSLKSGGALPTAVSPLALSGDVLKLDSANTKYANGAIVVRYSGYTASSLANTAIASAYVNGGSEDAGCRANNGILNTYWGTTVNRSLNRTLGSYSKDNVSIPASGYMILAYNTGTGTAAYFTDKDKGEWKGGYDDGIKWSGKTVVGFAVGGPRQANPNATMGPCSTMTIEAVAVFENYNGLNQSGIEELMAYKFPRETAKEAVVAEWTDFNDPTSGDFTWTIGNTCTVNADGSVTIGASNGLTLTVPSSCSEMYDNRKLTVILDADIPDFGSTRKALIDAMVSGSNKVSIDCDGSKMYQLWNGNTGYGDVSFALSGRHLIAYTYQGASGVGTTTYVDGIQKMDRTGLQGSSGNITKIGIGNYNTNGGEIATGMRVYRVAIFAKKLSAAEVAAYKFPTSSVLAVNFSDSDAATVISATSGDIDVLGMTIPGSAWFDSNKTATQTNPQTVTAYDLNGKEVLGDTAKVIWTSKNTWKYTDVSSMPLKGYLDDGNHDGKGAEVHFTNIPFSLYDAIIIYATDKGTCFNAPTVNDESYTYKNGEVCKGSDTWGTPKTGTIVEGVNALRIKDLTGPTLDILATPGDSMGSANRACIAAVVIVERPAKATATISANTNWSGEGGITWDNVAPKANSPVELTFSGSYTLTLNEAAVGKSFLIKGISLVDQTIKIAGSTANVAAFAGKATLDSTFTGNIEYEFDCTAASLTADAALKTLIKDATTNVKFVFKGSGSNGATLDFTNPSNTKTLKTHLVFDGGTHTFKQNGAENNTLLSNGSIENPSIFVTGGATFTLMGKDITGYSGSYIANGVIKVDDEATLEMRRLNSGNTFFYRQQVCLMPGATMRAYGSETIELYGGAADGVYEIYVPDSGAGNTKAATITGNFQFRVNNGNDNIAAYVGANSILKVEKFVSVSGNGATLYKRGAGKLEFTGSGTTAAVNVQAGSLALDDTVTLPSVTLNAATTIDVPSGAATITALTGDYAITKTGDGVLKISGLPADVANSFLVNAGVLKLGLVRSVTIDGSSTGAIEFTITDAEKATLEGGDTVEISNISGDELAGTLRIFDTAGVEYQIGDLTCREGKIVIAKKADAKVPPFNLATAYVGDWTGAAWKDSTAPEAKDVGEDDWNIKVDANITLGSETTTTLAIDRGLELAHLTIANAGTLAINNDGNTIAVDAIDDSASTGATTIGFDVGAATITAGANTTLASTGTGTLTIGDGKKATVPGWDQSKVSGAGNLYINAATPETAVSWNKAESFGGVMRLDQGTWTVTAGGNAAGYPRNSAVEIGPNGTLFITTATDATGYNGDLSKSLTIDGGTVKFGKRDTFSRSLILKNGGKLLMTADNTDSNRALDMHGSSSIAVQGSTPIVIGGLTEGSTTASGIIAIRRANFTVTVEDNATLKCYSQWGTADGSGNDFIKAGAGIWEQYRAANNTLKFALQGGTLKLVDAGRVTNGEMALGGNTMLELNATEDQTIANVISGTGSVVKSGAGTTTLTGANTYTGATTVNAGKLVVDSTFTGSYVINADGAAEFIVDTTATDYKKPSVTTLNGTLVLKAKATSAAIRSGEAVSIATLPIGVDQTKVTAVLVDKETGAEVVTDVAFDATTGEVTAKLHIDSFTLTPTSSSDFTWAAEEGSLFDEDKSWTDFGNVEFKTTVNTTSVALPALINASDMKLGGIYNFSGSPLVASALSTIDGAKATFANDVVADDVDIDNGELTFASLTANDVDIENATIKAGVIGPSMKYVRLTVTATQTSGNQPAVGEFRLYRGSATTGYTIVDWPVGTKITESTGLTATKAIPGYPAEVGTANESQPGVLIDGYYGNKSTPVIYGSGAYNTPAYNKWWPRNQGTGPWVVTIKFPYPVATFSGCNFCLADHGPRNPTAWTIEVSSDGETWTKVSEESDVVWSAQYAWSVAEDKPDNVEAENWPAFLNTGTTPTAVTVKGTSTIVADGNWTVDLDVEGALTLKGVAGKHLTLDAASASEFGTDATLTFDLSAYEVTQAGKQYVIAGPTAGWPDVDNITVIPEGVYTVGMDSDGYYVEVQSGNYWIGGAEGVGDWKLADPEAMMWGKTADSTEGLVWLNGAVANFTRNADVTIAEGVEATGIEIASENINVALKGALSAIATTPINISGAGATLTIENADAFDLPAITESADAAGKLVKKGAGTLTLSVNNTFTGGVTIESGTAKFGGADGGTNKGPLGPYANNTTDWTVNAVVKSGATLDINGKQDMTYVIELEGGATFTSSSATDIDVGNRQTKMLKLSGDATIAAPNGMFGLHNGGDYETKLELGNYTLTKTGAGTFEFVNTTATGAGTLDVTEGTIRINTHANGLNISEGTLKMRDGTTLKLDQPLVTKNLDFNGATVTGNARLTVNGALTGSGTIPNLTFGDGATVTANGSWQATSVAFGSTLIVNGNVGDTLVSGLATAPATLPLLSDASKMLKYENNAIVLAQAAASFNGKGYATLAEAITAANDSDEGGTITIYSNSGDLTVEIADGKTITIACAQGIYVGGDSITKTGAGTLVLDGASASLALDVVVEGGELVLTDNFWRSVGFFAGEDIAVAPGATIEFRNNNDITGFMANFIGTEDGFGTVRKSGTGTIAMGSDVFENFGGDIEFVAGGIISSAKMSINKSLKIAGEAYLDVTDETTPGEVVFGAGATLDLSELADERTDAIVKGALSVCTDTLYCFASDTANIAYPLCNGTTKVDGVVLDAEKTIEAAIVVAGGQTKIATLTYGAPQEGVSTVKYANPYNTIWVGEDITSAELNEKMPGVVAPIVSFADGVTLTMTDAFSTTIMMYCYGNINLAGTGTIAPLLFTMPRSNRVINIASGVIFAPAQPENINAYTITGAGTIVYDGALPGVESSSYQSTDNWTGTVWLKNKEWKNFDFGSLGHAGSKIMLTGITGYGPSNSSSGANPEIILKDEGNSKALTITDGYSTTGSYFFAKVSGDGTFTTSKTGVSATYILKDVSTFTGKIENINGFKIAIGNGSGMGYTSGSIQFIDGTALDGVNGVWTVGENTPVVFGSSLTVKLASAPIDGTPAKFLNGSFSEQTFNTALTVMVNDQPAEGDFAIKQDANGVWAMVNAAAEWTGTADSDWNNENNWSTSKVPTGASNVTIPNDANISLTSASIASTITLAGSATLTMDGVTAANIKNIEVPANKTLTIDVASGKTATVGLITGEGALAKTGAGELTLSAANTFAGGVVINGGVVTRGATNAFGAANTTVEVKSGASLNWGDTDLVGNAYRIKIAGTGAGEGKSAFYTSTNRNTLSGGIQRYPISLELTGDASIGGTYNFGIMYQKDRTSYNVATVTLNGHTLTKVGSGIFYTSNLEFHNGTVVVDEGTLSVINNTNNETFQSDAKLVVGKNGHLQAFRNLFTVYDVEFKAAENTVTKSDNNHLFIVKGTATGSFSAEKLEIAAGAKIPVTSEIVASSALTLPTEGTFAIDVTSKLTESGNFEVITGPTGFNNWDLTKVALYPTDAEDWEVGAEGNKLVASKLPLNATVNPGLGDNFGEAVLEVKVSTIDSSMTGTKIKVVTTKDGESVEGVDPILVAIDGSKGTYEINVGNLTKGETYDFNITFVDSEGNVIEGAKVLKTSKVIANIIPGTEVFSADATGEDDVIKGGAWGATPDISEGAYVIDDETASVFGVTDKPTGNYTIEYELTFAAGFMTELTAEATAPIAGLTISKEETDETTYWYRADSEAETGWSKLDQEVTPGHYIIRMAFTDSTVTYSVKGDEDTDFTTLSEGQTTAFTKGAQTAIQSVSFLGSSSLAKFGAKTDDTIDPTIALDGDSQLIESAEGVVAALSNGKTVTLKTNVAIDTTDLEVGTYNNIVVGDFNLSFVGADKRVITFAGGVLTIAAAEISNGQSNKVNQDLNLDPTDEDDIPFVKAINSDNPNAISFKLFHGANAKEVATDESANENAKFFVESCDNSSFTGEGVVIEKSPSAGVKETLDVPLPTGTNKVRYYRLKFNAK